jgi:hypothetical protein
LGGEFSAHEVQDYLKAKGIKPKSQPPATPQYNMKQERRQLYLEQVASAQLMSSPLTAGMWDHSWMMAVTMANLRPGRPEVSFKTPFERWHGRPPTVNNMMRPFGCLGYCLLPKKTRRKNQPKVVKAWLIGYDEERRGYRMLVCSTRTMIVSRDVQWAEGPYVQRCAQQVEAGLYDATDDTDDSEGLMRLFDETPVPCVDSGGGVETKDVDIFNPDSTPALITSEDDWTSPVTLAATQPRPTMTEVPAALQRPETTDDTPDKPTVDVDDEEITRYLVMTEAGPSMKRAMQGPEAEQWREAMNREWQSFKENKVFELIPRSEAVEEILRPVVVLTKKTSSEGEVVYKARCCVDGSKTSYNGDTYAPVMDKDSLRLMVSLAMRHGMVMEDFDVKTAYLYGELEEPRYMELPGGVEPEVDRSRTVMKLLKGVYGLPESGNKWHMKLTEWATEELGFSRMTSSPAIFYKTVEQDIIMMGFHVDDGKVAAAREELKEETIIKLQSLCKLKRMGLSSTFVGIQQEYMANGNLLWHHEEKILALVKDFDDQTLRPTNVPLSKTTMYKINTGEGEALDKAQTARYHSGIHAIMWLQQNCRPDVSFTCSILSRYVEKPTTEHWAALLLLIGYLKSTAKMGLVFSKDTYVWGRTPARVSVYSDADWGTETIDSKSTSGILILVNDDLVVFSSKKQSIVALSTVEAEGVAMVRALQLMEYVCQFLGELGMTYTTPEVYLDNSSLIAIVKGNGYRARTKHMLIKFNHAKDLFNNKMIVIRHCPSISMLADILTKPLCRASFERNRSALPLGDF